MPDPSPRSTATAASPAARWRDMVLFNAFYVVAASDVTSLSVGGGNVRVAWVLLPLLLALVPRTGDERFALFSVVAFYAIHLLASVASGELVKGFVYSSWILVNYYFFFRSGYALAKRMGDDVWDAFLVGGRLQVVAGVALFLAGVDERTRFTYYEPSYLAIGLVPYVFCTVFRSRKKWLDGAMILAVVATNQSANMLIAVLIATFVWLLSDKRFKTAIAIVTAVPLLVYGAYRWTLGNPDSPNYALASWVHENGIDLDLGVEVLARAGNRYPRIQAALDVLEGHWALGIGPGRYVEMTDKLDFSYITGGVDFLDPAGLPVINVFLEALASAGIGAVALLLYFVWKLGRRILATPEDASRRIMLGSLIAIAVMLQIESGYLRAYLWLTFGAFVAMTRITADRMPRRGCP